MKNKKKQPRRSLYGPTPTIDPGAPPATLAAAPEAAIPHLRVLAYGPDDLVDEPIDRLENFSDRYRRWPVIWVQVTGLGQPEFITRIGETFGLHPLALEDVLSGGHRPKVDEFSPYLFVVLQAPAMTSSLELEQVAIFFNQRMVLTFQESEKDIMTPLRDRLTRGAGRIRRLTGDYLAYALVDAVVDRFFPVLDRYDEALTDLEDEVMATPSSRIITRVHEVKRDLKTLRRTLWPLREVMNRLLNEEVCFISDETRPFLRDCYDHVIQAIDLVEVYREVGADLSDIYLSSISLRMNEIMKVLTIIATIFIPLTFVVGLYGMNFKTEVSPWNMPELGWAYGYPAVLLFMALIVGGMLLYFKKKAWL